MEERMPSKPTELMEYLRELAEALRKISKAKPKRKPEWNEDTGQNLDDAYSNGYNICAWADAEWAESMLVKLEKAEHIWEERTPSDTPPAPRCPKCPHLLSAHIHGTCGVCECVAAEGSQPSKQVYPSAPAVDEGSQRSTGDAKLDETDPRNKVNRRPTDQDGDRLERQPFMSEGSQPSGPTPLECLEAMIYLADIGETPAKVTVNLYREVAKRAKGDRP
jgi:hypothetical protein